jgi:hypothetical protein
LRLAVSVVVDAEILELALTSASVHIVLNIFVPIAAITAVALTKVMAGTTTPMNGFQLNPDFCLYAKDY